jgi:hypothetical protein
MPSAPLDLATSTIVAGQVANPAQSLAKPIIPTSAAPPTLGEVRPTSLALSLSLLYITPFLLVLPGL